MEKFRRSERYEVIRLDGGRCGIDGVAVLVSGDGIRLD